MHQGESQEKACILVSSAKNDSVYTLLFGTEGNECLLDLTDQLMTKLNKRLDTEAQKHTALEPSDGYKCHLTSGEHASLGI